MKKTRKQWLKCFNYLLSGVLLLLGFSSCLNEDGEEEMRLEYGQPHAKYSIKGKVVNSDGEQLPDIQLIVKGIVTTAYNERVSTDTLYSDTKGEFEYTDGYAWPDIKYRIIHRDLDKDGNIRKYKTDSVPVTMPPLTDASGAWNVGNASAEITIELVEKEEEEEAN